MKKLIIIFFLCGINTSAQYVEIGKNYRVHPSNHHQTETPIISHPTKSKFMFASANTYGVGGATNWSCGVYLTTNGGTNWFGSDTSVFNYGDTAPCIDSLGRLYITYTGRTGNLGAAYSSDTGKTWTAQFVPGSSTESHQPTMTAGNGRVWSVYTDFGGTNIFRICMTYTSNGGVNWANVVPISPVPPANRDHLGAEIAIHNNIIYVAWAVRTHSPLREDSLSFAKSTNNGLTWTVKSIADINGIFTSDVLPASDVLIRANGLPQMDIGSNGYIYITTCEKFISPAVDSADVILTKSTDGGNTWIRSKVNGYPTRINSIEYFSCINIDEGGGVNICYYSTKNTPTRDSVEVYLSRSTDAGNTFSEVKVSDRKFKPIPTLSYAAGYQGDYIGITSIEAGIIFPYWCEQGPISGGKYQAWTSKVKYYPQDADLEKIIEIYNK